MADIALTGTADGDSRWFEAHSDSFAQLNQGYDDGLGGGPDQSRDGFFRISAEAGVVVTNDLVADLLSFDPTTFNPTVFDEDLDGNPSNGITGSGNPDGSQGLDIFVNEESYTLGTLVFDDSGATGTGSETFSVTGYNGLDFFQNIQANGTGVGSYTTLVDSVTGDVTFTNGQLTDIDIDAMVIFTYANGQLPYAGTFSINGNAFELFVDQTQPTGFGSFRYIWDSTGTIDQVIPEPASALVLFLGGSLAFVRRR